MSKQNNEGKLPDFLEDKFLPENKEKDIFTKTPEKIEMMLNVIDNKVVLVFRHPVKTLVFNRQQTITLANILMSAACNIK